MCGVTEIVNVTRYGRAKLCLSTTQDAASEGTAILREFLVAPSAMVGNAKVVEAREDDGKDWIQKKLISLIQVERAGIKKQICKLKENCRAKRCKDSYNV